MSLAALQIQIEALDRASKPIQKIAGEIEKLESVADSVTSVGDSIRGVGESLTASVTAPVAAGLGLATFRAMNFETAMQGVNKAFGVAAGSSGARAMEDQVLSLSASLGSVPTDVAAIATETGKLGVAQGQFEDYVRVVTSGAAAFDMTADQAGATFADLTNVMGYFNAQTGAVDMAGLESLADTINYFADNGATSEGAIADVLTRAGGATRQFGLLNSEATALAASFLNMGAESSTVGTAINGILPQLQNATQGTAKFQGALEQIGLPAAEFEKMIAQDAAGAVTTFLQAIKESGDSSIITRMFGQGSDAALLTGLVGNLDAVKASFEAIDQVEAGSMMRTFEEQSATTEAGLASLHANLQIVSITIGQAIIPHINKLANDMIPVVQRFAEFARNNPGIVSTGVAIAGVAAAIGPLLVGVGMLAQGFGAIIGFAAAIKTVLLFSLSGPAVAAVGSVFALAAGLVAVVAVVAAVVARMRGLELSFSSFGEFFKVLASSIMAGLMRLHEFPAAFALLASQVPSAFGAIINAVNAYLSLGLAKVKLFFAQAKHTAISGMVGILTSIVSGGARSVAAVVGVGSRIMATLAGIAAQALSAGRNIVQNIAQGILSGIGSVVSAAKSVASAVMSVLPNSPVPTGPLTALNNIAHNPGAKIVDMLSAGMMSQAGTLGSTLGGALSPAVSPAALVAGSAASQSASSGGGGNSFAINLTVSESMAEQGIDALEQRIDELMARYGARQERLSFG
ncbi:MAG: phage tail tape measure protein [Cyanobacteria bacterium P01_H01_bin.26]